MFVFPLRRRERILRERNLVRAAIAFQEGVRPSLRGYRHLLSLPGFLVTRYLFACGARMTWLSGGRCDTRRPALTHASIGHDYNFCRAPPGEPGHPGSTCEDLLSHRLRRILR
jgi:hypothetical protein